MVKGRTVSVTRTVRPKHDKEKTIVIRYPKGCCKYREELLPINRVQEISTEYRTEFLPGRFMLGNKEKHSSDSRDVLG